MGEKLVGFRIYGMDQTECVRVFQETGFIGILHRVFKTPRTVNVPSKVPGVDLSLYGTDLFGDQRLEVSQGGKVIFKG